MRYSPEPYSFPEEYQAFDPRGYSRSTSDYYDDDIDDGSLNHLVDTIDRNQNYRSNQRESRPFEGNDQQFSDRNNRYYSPVPDGTSTKLFKSSSVEFLDEYDDRSVDQEITPVASTSDENGSNRPGASNQPSSNLIPITELPECYHDFFGFSHFNSVQSECFPIIYKTNHNALTNAPTGSGKTVLFELAILRMLEYSSISKGVYMAPTKSLCAERFRDWSNRFAPLGIKCLELTGDSENAGLADAKLASIIITTPEKWDSMTRRWFEFSKLLNNIRLVCIDEVHMLTEERGSVLEVIVARMKTLGTNIRLIALSATAPNICDVAEWLGDGGVADQTQTALTGQAPAKTFIFGEEHRPVKLSKFVYGYPRRPEHTEYQFMSLLNFKLMDHIISHSSGRPYIIRTHPLVA